MRNALLISTCLVLACIAPTRAADPATKKVAAVVTEYRHNSHADVIVSRLLLTDMLDGTGKEPALKLAALFTDQKPPNDISRLLAASHRFPIKAKIADTITLGTDKPAVDGVLLVAEHGNYPFSATGNHQYPKRRFWDETIEVFRKSGKVVPIFIDKHLSDNWEDAKHVYDTAKELKIPLMAGSSVPGTWRHPPADVARGAMLKQIVGFTYGTTDAYGFHGLEAVQSLAEQREGGETGVSSVGCLVGEPVWKALDDGTVDPALFDAAWSRVPGKKGQALNRKSVPEPKLMMIEHKDGLKVFMFELNGAIGAWTAAWSYADGRPVESTEFWTQEARPGYHFQILLDGVEKMIFTGKPSWPVERTLLDSGVLDAALKSSKEGGRLIETPYLDVVYQPTWRWKEPPPPPPGRPWAEQ